MQSVVKERFGLSQGIAAGVAWCAVFCASMDSNLCACALPVNAIMQIIMQIVMQTKKPAEAGSWRWVRQGRQVISTTRPTASTSDAGQLAPRAWAEGSPVKSSRLIATTTAFPSTRPNTVVPGVVLRSSASYVTSMFMSAMCATSVGEAGSHHPCMRSFRDSRPGWHMYYVKLQIHKYLSSSRQTHLTVAIRLYVINQKSRGPPRARLLATGIGARPGRLMVAPTSKTSNFSI